MLVGLMVCASVTTRTLIEGRQFWSFWGELLATSSPDRPNDLLAKPAHRMTSTNQKEHRTLGTFFFFPQSCGSVQTVRTYKVENS